MKQLFTKHLILSLLLFTCLSCSGKKFFADVPSGENITKVSINKTMMKLAGASASNGLIGVPGMGDAIKSLDNIEVITCEDIDQAQNVKLACQNAVNTSGYELVTEVEDGSDTVHIYMAPDSDNDNFVNGIVVLVSDNESGDYVAVHIKGKIDLAKLAEMANNK